VDIQSFCMAIPVQQEIGYLGVPDFRKLFKSHIAIDLMVKIKGLDFQECYADSILFKDGDLKIKTIRKSDLIKAKKSAGRAKDLNDLENIE